VGQVQIQHILYIPSDPILKCGNVIGDTNQSIIASALFLLLIFKQIRIKKNMNSVYKMSLRRGVQYNKVLTNIFQNYSVLF